ncbi:hypothetical protein E2C01_043240 [Portunus trituberculatus]|uniref:DUF547 domain-containing protein n=1 Tax=Portunus trituberculatus TaxID=210409 RepID=A0A5B7FNY2_PORTR|nr:hypothetical protein [Portunus trituberculatus]
MFLDDDPRLALTLPADHRIHGALNCGARSCPPLQAYYKEQLEQQLDEGLHTFCNSSVTLLDDNSLVINSIFQWFRVDFGSTEASVLEWLAEQVTDPTTTQALLQASRGQRHFRYSYDWTLNAESDIVILLHSPLIVLSVLISLSPETPTVVQWNHACFGVRGVSKHMGPWSECRLGFFTLENGFLAVFLYILSSHPCASPKLVCQPLPCSLLHGVYKVLKALG